MPTSFFLLTQKGKGECGTCTVSHFLVSVSSPCFANKCRSICIATWLHSCDFKKGISPLIFLVVDMYFLEVASIGIILRKPWWQLGAISWQSQLKGCGTWPFTQGLLPTKEEVSSLWTWVLILWLCTGSPCQWFLEMLTSPSCTLSL